MKLGTRGCASLPANSSSIVLRTHSYSPHELQTPATINDSHVVSKRLRQRHGFEHRFALVHRFLKFRFGFGVVHPAAAGLHVGFALLEQRGADGDAGVQIAVEAEMNCL